MQIHHVVRQHVVISQRIHIIQVMQVVMHVVGYVMNDIIRIVVIHVQSVKHEINVHDERRQHVEHENGVQHEVQVVVI